MYYELAKIRQYTNNKGQPYFQVRLKKDSKLTDETKKVKPIALVDVDEIKEIVNSSNVEKYKELQANYNNTSEELVELKQQLQESKATIESLTSEVNNLKEEKIQLQEDLLNVEDKSEEIIQLQKDHKEEVAELNFKLNNEKDLNKELLVVRSDFLKQNPLKRLFKVEPESSKRIAKLKELPEEHEVPVEAKNSKD